MKEIPLEIVNFFDNDGRLKVWPSKPLKKAEVINWLGSSFEEGREYSEKEINEIIKNNISFGDYQLIRRELIEKKVLQRTTDGSIYCKLV